ncbi:unnamed protein product [Darwinula stevensoni]|uniref:Receptor expression-enhancing protein n=1 Tax=Darwinula stevensoni TaxID=69355 RepID=A0A7R9FU89_9CRUS|nr:unnamed protein product [Darwinula stevensoni]CAG0906600.1 unnamed protein product [Darwinula stevensoni]
MVPATITRVVILVLGHLYPAYASYKAIQSRNTREYVKWMMYWIVLALFTCAETLADIFLSFWFPLYEEIKILLIIWFISPATRGSSFLYRRFVHPFLQEKSGEIDEYVQNAQRQGTRAMLDLGRKGVACASNLLLEFSAKAYSFTSQSLVQGTRPGEGDGNGEGGKEQGGRPVRSRNTLPSLPNRQFSASQMDLGTRTAAGSSQDFQVQSPSVP